MQPDVEPLTLLDGVADSDALVDAHEDDVCVSDGDAVPECELVELSAAVSVTDTVTVAEPECDVLGLLETDAVDESVALKHAVTLEHGDTDGDALLLRLPDGDALLLRVAQLELQPESVADMDGDEDGECVADVVAESESEGDPEVEAEGEPEPLAQGDGDDDAHGKLDALGHVETVAVADGLTLTDGVAHVVADADTVFDAQPLPDNVAETELEGDTLEELDAVRQVEGDGDPVSEGERVMESVPEGHGDPLAESDADGLALVHAEALGVPETDAQRDALKVEDEQAELEGLVEPDADTHPLADDVTHMLVLPDTD